MNVPDKVAVTATLTVDYKAPTKADQVLFICYFFVVPRLTRFNQFVIFRCKVIELKGRKAFVEGTAEDVHGNILATARYESP